MKCIFINGCLNGMTMDLPDDTETHTEFRYEIGAFHVDQPAITFCIRREYQYRRKIIINLGMLVAFFEYHSSANVHSVTVSSGNGSSGVSVSGCCYLDE